MLSGHKRLVHNESNKVVLVFHSFGDNNDLAWRAICLAEEMELNMPEGFYRVEDLVFAKGKAIWRRRRSSFEVLD